MSTSKGAKTSLEISCFGIHMSIQIFRRCGRYMSFGGLNLDSGNSCITVSDTAGSAFAHHRTPVRGEAQTNCLNIFFCGRGKAPRTFETALGELGSGHAPLRTPSLRSKLGLACAAAVNSILVFS